MSPIELRAIRHSLGLSAQGFADFLRLKTGRTVRKWESGECPVPGPVEIVLELVERFPAVRCRLLTEFDEGVNAG